MLSVMDRGPTFASYALQALTEQLTGRADLMEQLERKQQDIEVGLDADVASAITAGLMTLQQINL
jgi:hypothetical protein